MVMNDSNSDYRSNRLPMREFIFYLIGVPAILLVQAALIYFFLLR